MGHQNFVGERVNETIKAKVTEFCWFLPRAIISIDWLYLYTDLIYFDYQLF